MSIDASAEQVPVLSLEPATGERKGPWRVRPERGSKLLTYVLLILYVGMYGLLLKTFQVPAHSGTDQNGYLGTARLMVEDRAISFLPDSPFQFAGHMMVAADSGRIYAKYPFGFPLLAAIGHKLYGIDGMYWVNPICTVLAGLVSFFLFRSVLNHYMAFLGMIWLTCNPITLAYANDANSHASTLLCVVVGFWGLLRWWQTGSAWRGFIGGFALGYACTIRYTEFLLVLPVLFVTLAATDWKRVYRSLPPLLGWAIPIGTLAIVCWVAFGAPWRTGYYYCREQTGFGMKYFLGSVDQNGTGRQGNWVTLLHQYNHTGMFFLLPIVLMGMCAIFSYSWKIGTTIVLWVVPPTVLYLFYYWAPTGEEGIGYLRFFVTVFPGMILAGLWLLQAMSRLSRVMMPISVGVLTSLAALLNVWNILPHMENAQEQKLALKEMINRCYEVYPKNRGNVLFTDENSGNQLDSIGGYKIYETSLFQATQFASFKGVANEAKMDDPNGLQRTRAKKYMEVLGAPNDKGVLVARPQAEIDKMMMDLIDRALAENHRVAFIFHGKPSKDLVPARADLAGRELTSWPDPPTLPKLPAGVFTRWTRGVQSPTVAQSKVNWVLYEIVKKDQRAGVP